jgi:hypothetical protein
MFAVLAGATSEKHDPARRRNCAHVILLWVRTSALARLRQPWLESHVGSRGESGRSFGHRTVESDPMRKSG